jgi:hypothetical protein
MAFFGGFDSGASLMEPFPGFSFEAKVTETMGFYTLGSSLAASSLDPYKTKTKTNKPAKRGE